MAGRAKRAAHGMTVGEKMQDAVPGDKAGRACDENV